MVLSADMHIWAPIACQCNVVHIGMIYTTICIPINLLSYVQWCSPKILTRGALYKRYWALPKRKCLIFGS